MTIEERRHQWYCDMQAAQSEQEGNAITERHLREAIAEEREACALILHRMWDDAMWRRTSYVDVATWLYEAREAIRARGDDHA